jgi:hypothetical protein
MKQFAATLRDLDATEFRCGIDDAGLTSARDLVKRSAYNNPMITTVEAFAATLKELDASGVRCGIADAELASAHGIVKLNASQLPEYKDCLLREDDPSAVNGRGRTT